MWISNYYVSPYTAGAITMAWTNYNSYFLVLFCCCFIVFVDGIVLSIDFNRGGYASKMRVIISE